MIRGMGGGHQKVKPHPVSLGGYWIPNPVSNQGYSLHMPPTPNL